MKKTKFCKCKTFMSITRYGLGGQFEECTYCLLPKQPSLSDSAGYKKK